MAQEQENLLALLDASARRLQQGIEHHCQLTARLQVVPQPPAAAAESAADVAAGSVRGREQLLEQAVYEAIEVLEQSRRAFKSRQLEQLRKKLTQVLLQRN
ncbi:hypothetical protein [Desulfuromonas thiophila]|uniref:Uncharacterized protein n=1 Tax=Desulfuromonas thiophila TaxID=57664 RepID=A0A1G6ZXW6_9BACT|nr:hypothetical protein [Desulfuromonas thiophila]SDE07087.1 hypothetical protein SAMN05661003_103170 [Desulfuromonas thiophila]